MCAKINLVKFSCNTTHLGLAKFFSGENFPLYGTIDTIWQCIMGQVSAFGRLSNDRSQIMHEPKAGVLFTLDRYLIVLAH